MKWAIVFSTMENASREVKAHLKGLIGMKSRMDLEQIRAWLDKRISQLSRPQKVAWNKGFLTSFLSGF